VVLEKTAVFCSLHSTARSAIVYLNVFREIDTNALLRSEQETTPADTDVLNIDAVESAFQDCARLKINRCVLFDFV
jgi:hypothetical protein